MSIAVAAVELVGNRLPAGLWISVWAVYAVHALIHSSAPVIHKSIAGF